MLRSTLALLLLTALLALPTTAIKFDVVAEKHPPVKCIWNYALSDTLVVVTVNVKSNQAGAESDQRIDVEIVDGSKHNNVYLSKKNIKQETRIAINTHSHADLGVCISNHLTGSGNGVRSTTIDLDVDIGANAQDWAAQANFDALSALSLELRKLESIADEIESTNDYLKKREAKMRGTNFSTNRRVDGFAWATIVGLVVLGAWQVFHIRGFFKSKHLI